MKEQHFKVIVSFYNAEKWIKKCIDTIKLQKYKNYECILIDDASIDNTVKIIKQEISGHSNFHLIENKKNIGALANLYNSLIFSKPEDEDIITILDGDDWFARSDVFNILLKYYNDKDAWMTYGSHIEYPSMARSRYCMGPVPKDIIENNSYREHPWMTSALRTFKFHLWKKIEVEHMKNNDNEFYNSALELAYMFPMLEMSGEKAIFVEEILYVYNLHEFNDHVVPEKKIKQIKYDREIRNKNKYQRMYRK